MRRVETFFLSSDAPAWKFCDAPAWKFRNWRDDMAACFCPNFIIRCYDPTPVPGPVNERERRPHRPREARMDVACGVKGERRARKVACGLEGIGGH